MYHLLQTTSTPRRAYSPSGVLTIGSEPPTEPDREKALPAEEQSASPESEAFRPEEQPTEAETTYTVIGELLPPEEDAPTTIILDTLPVPLETQAEAEEAEEQVEEEVTLPPLPSRSPKRLVPLCWTLFGGAIVLLAVLVVTQLLPWWTPSATVTIVPRTQSITTTLTAHLVLGTADPARQQVQSRPLAHITMSQQHTVATTGSGYQSAQAAYGWIVLYNALDTPQTIQAGTLLTGQDGIQITTDTTVTIPAGQFASNGHVGVSAHAVESGPQGNIVAQDIHGPCCRIDVLAENPTPFTGGTLAHSYQAVSAQDIGGTATALTTTLMQQVSSAYQGELESGESLLTPVKCTTQVTADHTQGTEATHVTVTVAETCQGIAYQSAQLHTLVIQALHQQAQKSQVGNAQLDSASLHFQITASSTQPGDLHVKADGTLVFQWNAQQQYALAALIAGKSETQATTVLLQQPGVSTVSIHLTGRETGGLPDDPGRIHFTFLVLGL